MSLLYESHDSLPFIDPPPSDHDLALANTLIASELSLSPPPTTTLHPSIPTPPSPKFSPAILTALETLSSGASLPKGIDTSRYESLSLPPSSSTPDHSTLLEAYTTTLRSSQTSLSHLHTRHLNLTLLQQFGANANLISNHYLEAILKELERELAEAKEELEGVEGRRRTLQEGNGAEVRGLEEGWRKGVGRWLEVEAAAEGLRGEILRRRREVERGQEAV
ncbi:MAG: hypothetical protein M1820_007307 [Bogoriella megaspora]|nr:MAG: hypothetical protein M1820_007307 [Bogoriella megaspora]